MAREPVALAQVQRDLAPTEVGAVVLSVSGVSKAFHRGIWPMRRPLAIALAWTVALTLTVGSALRRAVGTRT